MSGMQVFRFRGLPLNPIGAVLLEPAGDTCLLTDLCMPRPQGLQYSFQSGELFSSPGPR